MSEEKFLMFRNRLAKVFRHLGKQAQRMGITCYRVYDHDLPEFPFCLELYNDHLYVAEYKRRHGMDDEEHGQWIKKSKLVMSEVIGIDETKIFVRVRQRKTGRTGQYQKQDGQKNELIVTENGLRFIVNLSDYLDTGLFLDHRLTRQMVREVSAGKNVLNLFAYTGSFSVYAKAGGAAEVVTVDLSKTYLQWAQRNFAINEYINDDRCTFIHADAIEYLKTIPPTHFDIIIMDPPSFSNSQRMETILDIQRDHVSLINDCLKGLKTGGRLYFSTNLRNFKMDPAVSAMANVRDMTKATTPFDFEGKLKRYCFLLTKDK